MLPARFKIPCWIFAFSICFSWNGVAEEFPGLDAAKDALGRFLPLAIAKGQLSVDDIWDEAKAPEVRDEELLDRSLVARGNSFKAGSAARLKLYHMITEKATGARASQGGAGGPLRFHYSGGHGEVWTSAVSYDPDKKILVLHLAEKAGGERMFAIETQAQGGMSIRIENRSKGLSVVLAQGAAGQVAFVATLNGQLTTLGEVSFGALMRKNPDTVQNLFLHPLADMGIVLGPSPELPAVMAAAISGFSAPASETARRVGVLLKDVGDEDMETRQKATAALIDIFPLAIRQVTQASEKTGDAEVTMRLRRVLAAHPGIARALPFVKEKRLHTNREYLLEIMAQAPFFKAAARARLAELCGKDYGDDAAAWPAK